MVDQRWFTHCYTILLEGVRWFDVLGQLLGQEAALKRSRQVHKSNSEGKCMCDHVCA